MSEQTGIICEKHKIGYLQNCPSCKFEEEMQKHPEICPMTGWSQWGMIEHPDHGWLMTYGGPYNSYTIPRLDSEGLTFERYNSDHDEGGWVEDGPEHFIDLQDSLVRLLKAAAQELPESHAWLRKRIEYVLSEVERVESEME